MLTIDGDQGEGGGQILRTALSLSLCRGVPFRIVNIRARRTRPGLQRQHLMAVEAAAALCHAEVSGDALGSAELTFIPQTLQPGDYRFDIGTAGSTTLVLQTLLPPLLTASTPSHLTLVGGTHNLWAPPYEFLAEVFLPLLRRMGAKVSLTLQRAGFYPRGGGVLHCTIEPVARLQPLTLTARGAVQAIEADALLANLPEHIARRELAVVAEGLGIGETRQHVGWLDAYGAGNVLQVRVVSEGLTELVTGFGQKGLPAEAVATGVVAAVRRYLDSGAPVGTHLADQLLLPLALAGGGEFITLAPDAHTVTNAAVINAFIGEVVYLENDCEGQWRVRVRGAVR